MPYKKGPNGTLRYYSRTTGRYCDDPAANYLQTKKRLSKKEKELERREVIENLAKKSLDKNLYTIFKLLESIKPGCVKNVNCRVFIPSSNKEREFDIVTSKAIYEIKSGKGRRKVSQYLAQMNAAKELKKDHVVYSPGSTDYQIKCMRKMGIKIFNNICEFKESEEKRLCKI